MSRYPVRWLHFAARRNTRFTASRLCARLPSTRMLLAGFLLLAGVSFTGMARADGMAQPGHVISRGAAPYTDTWKQMVLRDEMARKRRPAQPVIRFIPIGRPPSRRAIRDDTGLLPALPPFTGKSIRQEYSRNHSILSVSQRIYTSFAGINLQDQFTAFNSGSIPPDTMGAVGPNHFMEVINGSVAIYTRTGIRLGHVSLDSFFTFTSGGITYPRNGSFDPRVLYDPHSGRWFACALEFGTNFADNNILLAVSRTSDPTGTYDKYAIPVGVASAFTDYDTLGVDDNGVYFGMTIFPSTGAYEQIAATGKASLIAAGPSLGNVYSWSSITDMYSSPQPAHNLDAAAPADPAWFVASSTLVYGDVTYRTLTWDVNGVPTLSDTSTVTTPGYGPPLNAPARGSSTAIEVGDDRIQMALIRSRRLWTCRTVGVNSAGGSDSADRTGCEWLALDVSTLPAALQQSGRVYDSTAANPRFYYYPSLMVNGQGHAAMGFSGSRSSEYVGAYACGRLATDTPGTMQAVVLLKAGQASYLQLDGSRNRWGDYSYTSLDPNDDMSLWTIQEYATGTANIWGTWVARLLSPGPTLNNPAAAAAAGQTTVTLNLTGTGFYDPGAGYPNRLSVSLTGGSPNGIGNYRVTYNNPRSVTVRFAISAIAFLGPRDILLTNPDGQAARVAGGFTVKANTGLTVASVAGVTGQTVTLTAALRRTTDYAGLTGKTVTFQVNNATVGAAVTNAFGVASCSYLIPAGLGKGSKPIVATFAGDALYFPGSGTGILTVY
jgi:hypothetical protein